MKIESTRGPTDIPSAQQTLQPLHRLPDLGLPSATPPPASEVLGHLLNLPHDVPSEVMQKTLLLTFSLALTNKKVRD